MWRRLRHILEMIRFSHTLFALPFALLGAVMAWSAPVPDGTDIGFRWQQLLAILLCMVFGRSAGMAFNRVVDRDIDGKNPRTANRHIPAGILSAASVTLFLIVCSALFVASTLLLLPNRLPLILSVPVLLVLFAYSYTKRFTALAHFWLGLSLMLAPICAWIAIRGEIVMNDISDLGPPSLLGLSVLLWVAGFDIIYACQDYDFDVKAKLKSVPTALGIANALRLAAGCHLAMIGSLAALPIFFPELQLGWVYGVGIGCVAALLIWEHWLVRPDDLTRVNIAFFNINAVVSVGLFFVGAIDLLLV